MMIDSKIKQYLSETAGTLFMLALTEKSVKRGIIHILLTISYILFIPESILSVEIPEKLRFKAFIPALSGITATDESLSLWRILE